MTQLNLHYWLPTMTMFYEINYTVRSIIYVKGIIYAFKWKIIFKILILNSLWHNLLQVILTLKSLVRDEYHRNTLEDSGE